MKFAKYILGASLLCLTAGMMGSCDDDDMPVSEAVLASTSSLTFEAEGGAEKLITVYADALWDSEVPEWVNVSLTQGCGTQDVIISVKDNMRDGRMDNPRKAKLVFKGRTLASRSEVLVIQKGDKYRDVKEYTVAEILQLKDDEVLSLPEATVMAVTTKGFIVTDAARSGNIYVYCTDAVTTTVAVGDKVAIKGAKTSDTNDFGEIECDQLEKLSSGKAEYPEPHDITAEIDTFNSKTQDYISVSGFFDGSTVVVSEQAKYSVHLIDVPAEMQLAALNGHNITVKGYFAGLAAPVLRVRVAELVDDGAVTNIYFADDFEWLSQWSAGAGQTVENNGSGEAPNICTGDEFASLREELGKRGYTFVYKNSSNKEDAIYLQKNYLKFGKGKYQTGMVLPPLKKVTSGDKLRMTFNWAPMVGGSRKFDKVSVAVLVTNGDQVTEVARFEHSFVDEADTLKWLDAEAVFSGVDENSKITIRSEPWDASGYYRWFIDNIRIEEAL